MDQLIFIDNHYKTLF